MDTFYLPLYKLFFMEWIKQIANDTFEPEIIIASQKKIVKYNLLNYIGYIKIWDDNIVEEEIIDLNSNHHFYLHYHIKNLNQCINFYNDFQNTLLQFIDNKKIKVALCCTVGLSSQRFAIRLAKIVSLEKLNIEFVSSSLNDVINNHGDYNLLLIAPQIAHLHAKIIKTTNGKIPIYCIDSNDYAMNHYHRILIQIKAILKG